MVVDFQGIYTCYVLYLDGNKKYGHLDLYHGEWLYIFREA